MIYGVIGKLYDPRQIFDDEIIAGNGKTLTIVYYGKLSADDGREVITNFKTSFSTYMTAQEILNGFFDRENVFYGLSEVQKFLNSVGKSTSIKAWVEGLVSQRRKLQVDIMWDSQRLMSVDNRFREHTGRYYIPRKFHKDDGTYCNHEDCPRSHIVKVFSEKPFVIEPVAEIDAEYYGQFYNTNEIVRDDVSQPGHRSERKRRSRAEAI